MWSRSESWWRHLYALQLRIIPNCDSAAFGSSNDDHDENDGGNDVDDDGGGGDVDDDGDGEDGGIMIYT